MVSESGEIRIGEYRGFWIRYIIHSILGTCLIVLGIVTSFPILVRSILLLLGEGLEFLGYLYAREDDRFYLSMLNLAEMILGFILFLVNFLPASIG